MVQPSIRENIEQSLQSIRSLQTQPAIIAKISNMLQNPATNADELGRIIKADQTLASTVLRLVNSAFYGLPGRVGSISHAIVLLGFSTVKNIVLTASMLDIFKVDTKGSEFSTQEFYKHSLACAVIAQHLAQVADIEQKEECFVAGLLHDIGKLIMLQMITQDFKLVVDRANRTGCLLYDSENELLGINHQEIGGMLVEQWRLPDEILVAISSHHNPPPDSKLALVVHTADIFARALCYGNGGDKKIPVVNDVAWRTLKLDEMNFTNHFNSIANEWQIASACFQF